MTRYTFTQTRTVTVEADRLGDAQDAAAFAIENSAAPLELTWSDNPANFAEFAQVAENITTTEAADYLSCELDPLLREWAGRPELAGLVVSGLQFVADGDLSRLAFWIYEVFNGNDAPAASHHVGVFLLPAYEDRDNMETYPALEWHCAECGDGGVFGIWREGGVFKDLLADVVEHL